MPRWRNWTTSGLKHFSARRPGTDKSRRTATKTRRSKMAKVTFIGLGNMGGPMASNLLKAGHEVTVFDLSKAAVEALVTEGARTADSARAAADGAECVITMLPAGKHVEAVYLGDEGLLESLPAGTLLIDYSTIAPETSRKVAAPAADKDLVLINVLAYGCVSGAKEGEHHLHCRGVIVSF